MPSPNITKYHAVNLQPSPAAGAYVAGEIVTPSDTINLPNGVRGLWIGGSGNVSLVDMAGNSVTLNNVPVGELKFACRRVNATSTTATNIVALW